MQMWQSLMKCVKLDLMELAKLYDASMPASWKKERMARRVAELMAGNPDRTMMLVDRKTLRYVRSALEAHPDGRGYITEAEVGDGLKLEIVLRLRHVAPGLASAVTGPEDEVGFQLTEEWMDMLRSGAGWNEDRAKYLDSMARCFEGIVRTYGAMRLDDAHAMLRRCFPKDDSKSLRELMKHRLDLQLLDYVVVEKEGGTREEWIHCVVPECRFGDLYEELRARMDEIPYRAFTRRQYEFAAEHDWPVYPDGYQELLNTLLRLEMDREDVEDRLETAICGRQADTGEEDEILQELMEDLAWIDMPSMEKIVEMFISMLNSVPMWILKGNSPTEASRLMGEKKRKILPFPPRR